MHNYCSNPVQILYQEDPDYFKKSPHKLKGWTETVIGYCNEAEKLAQLLQRNKVLMKRPYTWAMSINIEAALSPAEITALWKKVCRKLEAKNVVALWVREPSRSNHCNYHLLVKNELSKLELEDAIEEAMPERGDIRWHKQVHPIESQFQYIRYITKAKTKAFVNGKFILDRYADKRLLFHPNLGLHKVGTIGAFWEKERGLMWKDIQAIEKQIGDALANPDLGKLARQLHALVGQDVPLKKIERSLGERAGDEDIKGMLQRLRDSE